jgi:hypothetical protein
MMNKVLRTIFVVAASLFAITSMAADDAGQIKIVNGSVTIERDGRSMTAVPGASVLQSDTLRTGANGSVGITLTDNTLLSAGPNSVLVLERYAFNSTTHQGQLDAGLRRGTLSMVSGKLAKQSPDAVRVITPATVLGARGTEFFVQVSD